MDSLTRNSGPRMLKFTVLISSNEWDIEDAFNLALDFRTDVHRDPRHPNMIIMNGEFVRDQITPHLGGKDFNLQVITSFSICPVCDLGARLVF